MSEENKEQFLKRFLENNGYELISEVGGRLIYILEDEKFYVSLVQLECPRFNKNEK